MKTKLLRAAWRLFAGAAILASMVPVRAQVPNNPSEWAAFVNGSSNTVISDTFRMQTFSQSAVDNWQYTVKNGTEVYHEGNALKVPLGGSVSFEAYSMSEHQKVWAILVFSAHSIVEGEKLSAVFDNDNGKNRPGLVYPPEKDKPLLPIRFGKNPCRFEFHASEPVAESDNGYFLIDSIYAYDTIPKYSNFSGKGNWNETVRWSHLPPTSHRSALLNGEVEVNTPIQCEQVCLGNGSLHIANGGRLNVDAFALHGTDISLTAAGNLKVSKQLSLHYTFPQKGKWYFLSFPVDIPLKGLDSRFQWKDDRFAGKGDYIYVQEYDGDKRALNNKANGNWTVLPASSSAEEILFERGKGYLVALDADASDNTLTFSIEGSDLPADFGQSASIPITASSPASANDAHAGWYLCGNPLPSPLPVSQLAGCQALDGNVYIYDGNKYISYPVSGNYVLPPFAAFFVKANANAVVDLSATEIPSDATRLKTSYALRATPTEPGEVHVHNAPLHAPAAQTYIKDKNLYLTDLPSSGRMQAINLAGKILYSRSVSSGSSVVPLPLAAGFYLIHIEAAGYRAQHKCILTQ